MKKPATSRRTTVVVLVALALTACGAPGALRSPEAAFERYFAREDALNIAHTTSGSLLLAGGAAAALSDDPTVRGAGWSMLGVGAVQVVTGVLYLVLRRDEHDELAPRVQTEPRALWCEEVERMDGLAVAMPVIRTVEGTAAFTGLGLVAAGGSSDDATMTGVGVGLFVASMLVLTVDSGAHDAVTEYARSLVAARPGLLTAFRLRPSDLQALSARAPSARLEVSRHAVAWLRSAPR